MVGAAGSGDFLDGALVGAGSLTHLKPNNWSNQNSSGNKHKSEQQVVSFWHPFHVASSSADRRHMAESRAN
jgi:hypothetical protein